MKPLLRPPTPRDFEPPPTANPSLNGCSCIKNSLFCHFGLPPTHPAHHPGGECICMFSFPVLLQHCPRLLKSYYHSCTGSPFSATLWTDPIGFISCAPSVMLPAASPTDPPVWLIQSPAIPTFHFLIPFVIMMRPGPSCFISLAPEVFEMGPTSATQNIVRYAIIMKTITQFNNGNTSLQGDGAAASTVAQGQWPFCLEPVSSPCVCFSLDSLASSHSIKTHIRPSGN